MSNGGFPTLTWIDPDGVETPLTTHTDPLYSRYLVGEVDGLGAPEIVTWGRSLSLADGGVWTGAKMAAREIFLPIAIDADTFAGRKAAIRGLSRAFLNGGRPVEGSLRVNYFDGEVRTLRKVRMSDGLREPMPGPGGFYLTSLTLVAYDPLLYGREQEETWTANDPDPFFPGPPFTLTRVGVTGGVTIDIPGEVAVWPTWVLEGPLTNFTASDGTTSWQWTVDLVADEIVVIDTDPRTPLAERVTNGSTGANRWSDFVDTGFQEVFPLLNGSNDVTLTFVGEGTGTLVSLRWTPAYLTW